MVRALPLRNGYFRQPRLTELEETELIEWAQSLLPSLVATSEWKFAHEKKGVQICEDRQKGGILYSIQGTATVESDLSSVMALMTTCTTSEYRAVSQLLLRDHFLDSAVLYHKKKQNESIAIKWLALKSHSAIALDQDLCLLEYSAIVPGDVLGASPNERIGICMYESIEQTECPSLLDSHKLERGSISRCGYIFRSTGQDGVLEAQFVCSIRQPDGVRSRRRANRAILNYWAESLYRIQETISTRQISKLLTDRPNTLWVNDEERACCNLCLKIFSNIRRKHHCRACGEVICGKCCSFASVDLPSVGLSQIRICKSCTDASTSTPKAQGPEDMLALTTGQSRVPDDVGIAWLRQLAGQDVEKQCLIETFLTNLSAGMEPSQDDFMGVAGESEDIYDMLCDLASQALGCTYAVVCLVEENRQWFKSKVDIDEADIPRDFSFCEYPVRMQKPIVVMDTHLDGRFKSNPFVTGPLGVRFLAGAPLFALDGSCVGSVCVLDSKSRTHLDQSQLTVMEKLAHLAMVSMQERQESTTSSSVPSRNVASSRQIVVSEKTVQDPENSPSRRTELENQMMQLLNKSYQTRQQVDLNKRDWDVTEQTISL